jgi:hypothetical protein
MFILKRQFAEDFWHPHQCPLSKLYHFDTYNANFKCRRLVHERGADEAQVMDETGKPVALWRWNEHSKEAQKIFGPDL